MIGKGSGGEMLGQNWVGSIELELEVDVGESEIAVNRKLTVLSRERSAGEDRSLPDRIVVDGDEPSENKKDRSGTISDRVLPSVAGDQEEGLPSIAGEQGEGLPSAGDEMIGEGDVKGTVKTKRRVERGSSRGFAKEAEEISGRVEEQRSLSYSDIPTSERAKNQQQKFCGPFVALTFNFIVAVGIIMANKLVMVKVGFNFPIALSLIHYVTSWSLMVILKALWLLPASPSAKTTPFASLFALGAVMAFATGLANVSLQHNSVGFYQMAKIAVTPTIVLAEFLLFSKKVSLAKVISLTIVSIGVAIATVSDLQFNLFGACVAVAWIVPSAINKILWSNLQQTRNWTALALMWKTSPITVFFLMVLMPLLDPPGVLSYSWDQNNVAAIIISALFGFLLQWSGALALGATSATSHVVLGQFKTCVIMLSGYILFNSDPGLLSLFGAVVALCGMSFYTYFNLRAKKITSRKPSLPVQNTFSPKHKTTYDEEVGKVTVLTA